jgi:hypothetical protein
MFFNNQISIFESFVRTVVEGAFDRKLSHQRLVKEIARQLDRAVEQAAEGLVNPPNLFNIELHPGTLEALLRTSPELSDLFKQYLLELAKEYDLKLSNSSAIKLVPNDALGESQFLINPVTFKGTRELTVRKPINQRYRLEAAIDKLNAFLILNGKRHINLKQPLITVGRHLESDIVLDDPAVSRQHAQLRWSNGHFIIMDLGSKSGLRVNNKPVDKHVLENGDVILLGQSSLIYGDEQAGDGENFKDQDATRQLRNDNPE